MGPPVRKDNTCRRLSIQLSILGYHPVQISLDNFFVEREQTPVDEWKSSIFEAFEALDLALFHDTMERLLQEKRLQCLHLILE